MALGSRRTLRTWNEGVPKSEPSAFKSRSIFLALNNMVTATKPRQRSTYMLHEVDTYFPKGKMQGSDFRYAALKAASRGHTKIWIRRTNTKEMREYEGSIVKLDTPKKVKRGDRVIEYTRRPAVKFVRKWIYQGAPDDEAEQDTEQPIEQAETAPTPAA